MTLNSALRSMAAASRRAERESIRRQREYQRQFKEEARLQLFERIALAVSDFQNKLSLLRSIHQDCSAEWDWNKLLNSEPPVIPIKLNTLEKTASEKLDNFIPSFFDKIFKQVEKKKLVLEKLMLEAKEQDENDYITRVNKYREDYREWEELKELSKRIMDKDLEAFKEAVEQVNPFSEITGLGSGINFKFISKELIEVNLKANSSDVIPSEELSQLKSGKLSSKPIPKNKFNEIYQDYVCGCVLRIARELFALLPIEKTIVTAEAQILNTASGYLETKPILSVLIPKQTLNNLNFDSLDPSDSMKNFKHKMAFKKTSGFEAVDKLILSEFE